MLKTGRFTLVMDTIPSLNCVYAKALPATEHQEPKAEAARDFRVEKEHKIAAQLLCRIVTGIICEMKGRIGCKLVFCS